jgi:hypothetical protein
MVGMADGGGSGIGILARREIEAGVIGPIFRVLVREFGEDKARDVIAEGFDPRMGMDRPQTIMSGAPTCRFRYTLADPA